MPRGQPEGQRPGTYGPRDILVRQIRTAACGLCGDDAVKLPFLRPPSTISPYNEGYLSATRLGTKQQDGGIVRMPRNVFSDGSQAQAAYIEGVSDSISDRGPRQPTDRVSRAYPKWRLI